MEEVIKAEYDRILDEVWELIPCMPMLKIDKLTDHYGIATRDINTGEVELIRIDSNLDSNMVVPVICHELAHCTYFDHSAEHGKLMEILLDIANGNTLVSDVISVVDTMAAKYKANEQIKENNLANFFA